MNRILIGLIGRRIAVTALTLLIVSAIIFTITNLLPGDAAQAALGQSATPETVAALRQQFGLDMPAHVRYLHWLAGLMHGDFGRSFSGDMPVSELIGTRLPKSLALAAITTAVSVPIALLLGILAAVKRESAVDRVISLGTLSLVATPEFLIATVAVLVFAVKLRWLSALSYGGPIESLHDFLRAYAMPVLTLCAVVIAQMARMTRAAVIEQLSASYVEMAVLKGASPARVVLRHALPNAIGPIANAIALSLSYLLGGVIVVETIFNYPGLASLMVDAVSNRDFPLVQACTLIFCVAYLTLVLFADLCSIVSNPRLRT
ncbi:MAG: ABC transporter permease [Burkholderia contaminans]|uniref:ABC transporter permease n=1 Tax=Burkholderia contaminans TaxID=488447 RepID=A0AAP4R394_9BURK|nr:MULTISPECIES: ABC transporter permease [Burkholderia]MBD1410663.1 ABC transporter permease [Burkholderia contaminans]MBH9669366.1 ABC transporter permease [Burkholderia contaminans]MBH9676350.1 ABC transporter permease [Burkholderia contaminans]MBH9706774.1 ABC transporter permease [Burkholderia contaminans]MBM6425897.1 ABC transporter permease [Burkholderia contaminans]